MVSEMKPTSQKGNSQPATSAPPSPRIASRAARYRAVMKYHDRILETGSADRADSSSNTSASASTGDTKK